MKRTLRSWIATGALALVVLPWYQQEAGFFAGRWIGADWATSTTAAPALWLGLTVALLLWYLLDSGLSIALGYAGNAVSNSLLMIGYLVPMMATAAWQRR